MNNSLMSKSQREPNNDIISLSSLGVLEVNLYLTLQRSQINSMGIKTENINELADLSNILSIHNPHVLDKIVLLTNNTLINSLLFINRSFKKKTLIELITPSEIYFSSEHLFFKSVLNYVTDKNLLFIFENKITDIPSSITFTLKIIEDDTEEIEQKYFTIGKQTVPIDKELISCSDNLFDELAYKFSNDYFICSFESLLKLKQNRNQIDLSSFFDLLVKNYPKIHIITLFFGELLSEINDDSGLDFMSQVLDYTDIVIAEKNILQSFYKLYGKKSSNKSHLCNSEIEKAIIQESYSKKRTEIVKITILLDQLKTATIVMQEGYSLKVLFNATHIINFKANTNIDIFINIHLELLTPIFVGGFLSRLLHYKTFNTCLVAGGKVVSKVINNITINEFETNSNKEAYEVIVHMNNKNKEEKFKDYFDRKKKGFVLDCLNYRESQLKPYNAICDCNCANFLNSRSKWSFLKEQGFINKRGALLKDPQLIRKFFDKRNLSQSNKMQLTQINFRSKLKPDIMIMNETWKAPRMTFTKENPIQLPMMNKTQFTSMRNAPNNNDDQTQNKWRNKSKGKGGYNLEKEKLEKILLKFENKASTEIMKYNN